MPKSIKVLLPIFTAVILLAGCTPKKENQITGEAENINKQISQMEQGITVPANLTKCDIDKYFDRDAQTQGLRIRTDCNQLPQDPVCNYYKTVEKDGSEPVHVAQYTNACGYCRFFFGEERKTVGSKTFIDLGYQQGECTQGMYKK